MADGDFDLKSYVVGAAPPGAGGGGHKDPMLIGLGVVLVFAVVIWAAWKAGVGLLSRKLAAAGWVLYLQTGCAACTRQMKVLGGSYHRYVVCNKDGSVHGGYTHNPPLSCKGVKVTPYWHNARTHQQQAGLLEAPALYDLLKATKK